MLLVDNFFPLVDRASCVMFVKMYDFHMTLSSFIETAMFIVLYLMLHHYQKFD